MNCYYFIRDVRSHFISLLFIRKRDKLLRRSKYSFKERLVNRRYIILYIYIFCYETERVGDVVGLVQYLCLVCMGLHRVGCPIEIGFISKPKCHIMSKRHVDGSRYGHESPPIFCLKQMDKSLACFSRSMFDPHLFQQQRHKFIWKIDLLRFKLLN